MSKSELILEFIDGTLDSAVEQGLFQEMAQHPELRSELRQFINIADAVHSDREAFAPPAHLEHALMAGIGLIPATDSKNTAAGVMPANGGNRFWLMTSSFILGALLAASTMWLMLRGDAAINNESLVASPSSSPSTTANTNGASKQGEGSVMGNQGTNLSTIPSASSQVQSTVAATQPATVATAPAIASAKPQIRERIKYVYLPAPRDNNANVPAATTSEDDRNDGAGTRIGGLNANNPLAPSNQSSPSVTVAEPADTAARVTELMLMLQSQPPHSLGLADTTPARITERRSTFLQSSSPLSAATKQDNGVTIVSEVRYQFARNAVPTQALSASYSLPENFAAGAYVQLSDAWHLGAEIGVERYAQTLLINRHDTLAIDQQPRYTWGGLAARYDFGAIPSMPARLYFQVTGGATSAGPLVRFRLGAPVQLADGVAISPGFEFSSLVYMFNNQRLFSGRWGATVGTEFNLSKLIW